MRNDNTRAAGINRFIVVTTAVWRGDKMVSLRADRDLTDPETAAFTASQAAPAATPAPARTGNGGLASRPASPPAAALALGLVFGVLLMAKLRMRIR